MINDKLNTTISTVNTVDILKNPTNKKIKYNKRVGFIPRVIMRLKYNLKGVG